MKTEYGGQQIEWYRGALDGAFREVEALDLAIGLDIHNNERSRLYRRLQQFDRLVTALEQRDREE